MIFNSLPFVVFFLIFFMFYWLVFKKSLRLQNFLILTGSYVFYCWWDWRFLALLIGSSLLNYYLGIWMAKTLNERNRKLLLYVGILQGLGGLIFFKYYNFFITSFAEAFSVFNIDINVHTLQLILPLGISFYTFRTLSYILDIYNDEIKPATDWVIFFSYVAFFPSLVSGPIDRAKLLIPQLEKKREFDYYQATDGMRQILWGLFKKVVVADNCATITNQIFDNYGSMPASSLVFGALVYTFQVYSDFSGYSDMAIGFARLLGFNITKNFNFPFFAQNIAEFWQKWHISLTSWMTDYVYTPLSFILRRWQKTGLVIAIIINFILVGLWHGANWTFIVFGFLQGCYFIPLIIRGTITSRKKLEPGKILPTISQFKNILATFILVSITNIIFRSDSMSQALGYFRHIFSLSLFSFPVFTNNLSTAAAIIFSLFVLIIEWFGRGQEYAIAGLVKKYPKVTRWSFYFSIAMIIFLFSGKEQQFIYTQF